MAAKAKTLNRYLPEPKAERHNLFVEINADVAEAMNKVRERTTKPSGAPLSWNHLVESLLQAALKEGPQGIFESQVEKFRPSLRSNRCQVQARIDLSTFEAFQEQRERLSAKLGFDFGWMYVVEILFRRELSKLGVALKS